ncbi:MAG: hypothetical protein SF162_07520 [bacterium]|nr:hypothetical protein [bacterium]
MLHKTLQGFISAPDAHDPVVGSVRRVLEANAVRALAEPETDSGLSRIDLIRRVDFMIADVTGGDADVMYEIGLASGMGKQVVIIVSGTQKQLPRHLLGYPVLVYDPQDLHEFERFLQSWIVRYREQRARIAS